MTIGDAEDLGSLGRALGGRADRAARICDGARGRSLGIAVRTPTLASVELTEAAGTAVALKAECLQGTGSFKLRGALSKLAALGERAAPGLVTASAGNHGARARAGGALDGVWAARCSCRATRSVSKVAAVQAAGCERRVGGRVGRRGARSGATSARGKRARRSCTRSTIST